LKINFKKHGTATERIDRGDFAIQDSATTNDIDLSRDWETCFRPGQRVDMSMIFNRWHNPENSVPDESHKCPSCTYPVGGVVEESGEFKTWLVLSDALLN
jgi:hypothetical protein